MKIGIDARMFRSSVAGIGRYSQNLIKNLLEVDSNNQYVLFMTPEDEREFNSLNLKKSNVKVVLVDIPHFSIKEQIEFSKVLKKEKCDLVHFLNFNRPLNYKGKFIITVHDLTLLFYPETAKKTNLFKRIVFKKVIKSACENASKIISVSENSKKDIERIFNIDSNKIAVIYEAADDRSFKIVSKEKADIFKRKHSIASPVILYVGQWRPHKNLVGLIKAFAEVRKVMAAKLILIGKPNPEYPEVRETIDNLKLSRDIVMPGFVTDEELALWYQSADIFVFPSFYEGFGLPGLESMMAGTPVLAAKSSCLPEVYQDGALYFDPLETHDIADKIKTALENQDLRDELIKKGKLVAEKYSWASTARETLKVYKEVMQ